MIEGRNTSGKKKRFDEIHPERLDMPVGISTCSPGTFQNNQNDFHQDSR